MDIIDILNLLTPFSATQATVSTASPPEIFVVEPRPNAIVVVDHG